MIFVKVAAFALLLVVLLAPLSTPPVSAGTEHRCPEEHTDYRPACAAHPENTRCGSFCFYAVCHICTPGSHCHNHQHCSDNGCSNHCHRHIHHESPCTLWHWNIYNLPDPGLVHPVTQRMDDYDAPHLSESLEFGMLPDDYVPPDSSCTTEQGDTQILPGGLGPVTPLSTPQVISSAPPPGRPRTWKSGNVNHHITSLVNSHSLEVSVGDLSHLPETPGEPGAPALDSVTKVTDNSVTLQVSGGNGGVVQYRYWSYYGLREPSDDGLDLLEVAPTEFRVPFQGLGGEISIDEKLQGIFSFQVRSLDAEGVPSGNSNIRHEMIGMADFHAIRPPRRTELAFSLPLPTPPVWGTPLPPHEEGVRPIRPSIEKVSQVPNAVRTVEVRLAGDYSAAVEYRWWPHSGSLPTPAFEEWLPASVSNRVFTISSVEPRIPEDEPYAPVYGDDPDFPSDFPDASVFNFQVRLVNAGAIPGDPSYVKALLVWGGDYIGWLPGTPTPYSGGPVTPPSTGFFCSEGKVALGDVGSLLNDCRVLLELAEQVFGTRSLNWVVEVPVDDWNGVELAGSPQRVHSISLNNMEVLGNIPWSLGKLSELRSIELRGNELSGSIPTSLSSLYELQTLDLRDNHLVGFIPDLSDQDHLENLWLDGNDLTGVLTDKLDGMDKLTSLGLSGNSFYGVIPSYLTEYGLSVIRLSGNDLSGCIPPGLRSVPDNDINSLVGPVDCS